MVTWNDEESKEENEEWNREAAVEATIQEVLEDMDDEEPNYYDKDVGEDENQLIVEANLSRKTLYKRPTIVHKLQRASLFNKKLNFRRQSFLQRRLSEAPQVEEETVEQSKEERQEARSREGLLNLYEQQLRVGKGIGRPPYIVPYRFLGTPDLKRDDSLLPKTFQFVKRENFSPTKPKEVAEAPVEGMPMVLPLALRAAYWNGGRWCGTTLMGNQAAKDNGFGALYKEVVKSEQRRISCKTGTYFLDGMEAPLGGFEDKGARRPSVVSEYPARQQSRRSSVAKPFIPPLPLESLPPFDLADQVTFNQEILSAYRDESVRMASLRSTLLEEAEKKEENIKALPNGRETEPDLKELLSGRGTNGFPLKACEQNSLRQLGNILQTKANFRAMQHRLNTKLVNSLKAMETSRPYHYKYEFGMKGRRAFDPAATPRRAKTFRRHMEKNRWYEDLIAMAYHRGRQPTETEHFLIEDIRFVLDMGNAYGPDEFTKLVQVLGQKKMDMDSYFVERALLHVQSSLKMPDVDLIVNLLSSKSKLPSWLSRKTALVKQVIRDLAPNRFPQANWTRRPKSPASKFRKLGRPFMSRENSVPHSSENARPATHVLEMKAFTCRT